MRRITVLNHVSLDGVMQAPARADEDTRDGFTQGGWTQPFVDDVMGRKMGEGMAKEGGLLLGRRTFEDFASYWPKQTDNPYTDKLNRTEKYVVSNTLEEPLPWEHSTLVTGEAAEAVAELKAQDGPDLMVLGSGQLIQALGAAHLIDEYTLLINPIVLGHGHRLFEAGAQATLELVDSTVTTTGVIMATYRPAHAG